MFLTIFTPTYNRAYSLPRLYQSLCEQTESNFEWLIVDDGSTDDTAQHISGYINEAKITIRYFRQPNGGKHRAINKGVKEALGELFFIVDSDDYLTPDAVQWINQEYRRIEYDDSYAGLSGIRIYPTGTKIGGGLNFKQLDCNAIELRLKHNIKGDLSEIFRTSVMREFPFPEIPGEKFCPEALVWHRIAHKYKLRYIHKGIYVCEYLPDGLTAKIVKIRMQSPIASCTYYSEYITSEIPILHKIRTAINYWRFYFCKSDQHKPKISPLWSFALPLGWAMHIRDNHKFL